MAGKDKVAKKGIWGLYKTGKNNNRTCPKCGEGHYMAKHASRWTCGTCHYTEFVKQ